MKISIHVSVLIDFVMVVLIYS